VRRRLRAVGARLAIERVFVVLMPVSIGADGSVGKDVDIDLSSAVRNKDVVSMIAMC